MHRHVLHNDDILPAEERCLAAGQAGFQTGWGVFTTVRVSRGVLFAFERHFARMQRDARMLRIPFPPNQRWLEERLLRLIEANAAPECTLRVNIVRNRGGLFEGPNLDRDFDVIAFTADRKNWGGGARLAVEPQARHAASKFAGTKVTSWMFNLNLYEEAHERGFDELILLNERDEVSECTSANIFAVFGNEVYTPPLESGCLPGITRELLLDKVRVPGLKVLERTIQVEDLRAADEVFLTSSTRDILPVFSIDGLDLVRRGTVSQQLLTAFTAVIEDYVCSKALAI